MFQVSLNQMEHRQTEVMEFAEKLNRLNVRLEEETEALRTMKSFSEIVSWLKQTEERLYAQKIQAEEMGAALQSIVRFYRNSEENILECLENGFAEREDENLSFIEVSSPGIWPEYLEF